MLNLVGRKQEGIKGNILQSVSSHNLYFMKRRNNVESFTLKLSVVEVLWTGEVKFGNSNPIFIRGISGYAVIHSQHIVSEYLTHFSHILLREARHLLDIR